MKNKNASLSPPLTLPYHPFIQHAINDLKLISLMPITLLPHHYLLHLHLGLLPRGIPLILSLPKVLLGVGARVNPRLAMNLVLEPAVGSADRNIQDKIKLLIKGGVQAARMSPGVRGACTVLDLREVTALPKGLVEVRV